MRPIVASVRGFKSLRTAHVALGDLTVLLGPPSSGKSNFLEALTAMGYAVKLTLELKSGVYNKMSNIPPLASLIRMVSCTDLISRDGIGEARVELGPVASSLRCHPYNTELLNIEISTKGDTGVQKLVFEHRVTHGEEEPPLQPGREMGDLEVAYQLLLSLARLSRSVKDSAHTKLVAGKETETMFLENLSKASLKEPLIVPRLYSYDRTGAWLNLTYNNVNSTTPTNYLAEDASNMARILYTRSELVNSINEILEELAGITVAPLAMGMLAFFEKNIEVGSSILSDTVLRTLYTVVALLSTQPQELRVVDEEGQELTVREMPLIMLEELEAHVYPIAFTSLANVIKQSLSSGNRVIITTHSPRLTWLLWEKASMKNSTRIYYVYKEASGTTFYEINISEAPEILMELDTIVTQPPYLVKELIKEGVLKNHSPNPHPRHRKQPAWPEMEREAITV